MLRIKLFCANHEAGQTMRDFAQAVNMAGGWIDTVAHCPRTRNYAISVEGCEIGELADCAKNLDFDNLT